MTATFPTVDRTETKRETRRERAVWQRVRPAAERYYQRQLRKIAAQIGHVVSAFSPADQTQVAELVATLHRYSAILTPWARAVASRMLYETARRDDLAWRRHATLMGEEIEAELNSTSVGGVYQDLMARQVDLITSIPRDAAQRVHKLATEALYEGRRYPDIAAEIMRSNDVSRSKADLIARTEVGRAATTFQQVRAQAIGSTGFVWRSVGDFRTRPELGVKNFAKLNTLRMGSHRKLDGTFHRWDEPPIAGPNGERALPGAIYNCFPGSTPIRLTHGVKRVWRAWYEGDLVVLDFGRDQLSATPNHPILTQRGFVPASLLDEGDEIVSEPYDVLCRSDANVDKQITTLEELFFSFPDGHVVSSVGGLADFHGDVFNGCIDEVVAHAILPNCRYAGLLQNIEQLQLAHSNPALPGSAARCLNHDYALTFPSALRLEFDLLFASLGCREFMGSTTVSELNASRCQPFGYSPIVRGEPLGEGLYRQAAEVFRDNLSGESSWLAAMINSDSALVQSSVESGAAYSECLSGQLDSAAAFDNRLRLVNKGFRKFAGHVYTVQSYTGVYPVGACGAIAKNCRCYAEPVLPTTYIGGQS